STNPAHRLHERAARAVLKALLPEQGTDIRGHIRPHQQLLEASGYTGQPKEFQELLQILDNELRLITPSDPEGLPATNPQQGTAETNQPYYQLTHDYLVPALREWL